MKNYYKSTRNRLLLISLVLFCTNLVAAPVVRVASVSGNAFVLENNRTRLLQPGEHLEDYSEIITEEGSQVVFSDFFDHRYYLSGAAHVKLLNRILELRTGYLWIQSLNNSDQFTIQTANARVLYGKGEGIISFDNTTGRSQLLVVKGTFELGNLLQDYMITPVGEGQFSFIHNDYENGSPRRSTAIGETSFHKVTSLFQDIKPMKDRDKVLNYRDDSSSRRIAENFVVQGVPVRSVASVAAPIKKGEIVLIKGVPVSTIKSHYSLEDYQQMKLKSAQTKSKRTRSIKRPFKATYEGRANVKVVIYGSSIAPVQRVAPVKVIAPAMRKPASIAVKPKIKHNSFEASLVDEYKKQLRHNEETNRLIKELSNYDQDYKANY